nr:DUF6326 family protein [uncultured Allomuricauda sp.]
MKNKINSQSLLSTLWIFVLLNIIFRDLHQFLNQGYIEEMMNLNISEETKLFYGLVLEIPILMTVLSRILNNISNKWINITIASLLMIGTLSALAPADMDDVFFTLINTIAFLAIIYIAWKLPSKKGLDFSKVV